MLGILIAFSLTQLAFAGNDVAVDRVSTGAEIVLFALTLPLWVVLGRLYGLYSADEERADNSTVDDVFGVFNMLTVGAWLHVRGRVRLRVRQTRASRSSASSGCSRSCSSSVGTRDRAIAVPPHRRVRPEHARRRRRPRGAEGGAQAAAAPGVRRQRRRLRRRRPASRARRDSAISPCSAPPSTCRSSSMRSPSSA